MLLRYATRYKVLFDAEKIDLWDSLCLLNSLVLGSRIKAGQVYVLNWGISFVTSLIFFLFLYVYALYIWYAV